MAWCNANAFAFYNHSALPPQLEEDSNKATAERAIPLYNITVYRYTTKKISFLIQYNLKLKQSVFVVKV
jgi:hypothetical protein